MPYVRKCAKAEYPTARRKRLFVNQLPTDTRLHANPGFLPTAHTRALSETPAMIERVFGRSMNSLVRAPSTTVNRHNPRLAMSQVIVSLWLAES
jgi:hypothetical protein